MNAFAYIFTAWCVQFVAEWASRTYSPRLLINCSRVPIFTFPTQKQPYIVKGNYINAGFGGGMVILALVIGYFSEGDRKRAARNDAEAVNEQSSTGSVASEK